MRRPQNSFEPHPNPKNSPLGPKNVKIDTKINSKSNVRIEGNIQNESWTTTLLDPKTDFEPYPNPKNSPLGPQKVKNNPKINSKSNVRIEGNIENKSCGNIWMNPKMIKVFGPDPNPKDSSERPKKCKKGPKVCRN